MSHATTNQCCSGGVLESVYCVVYWFSVFTTMMWGTVLCEPGFATVRSKKVRQKLYGTVQRFQRFRFQRVMSLPDCGRHGIHSKLLSYSETVYSVTRVIDRDVRTTLPPLCMCSAQSKAY